MIRFALLLVSIAFGSLHWTWFWMATIVAFDVPAQEPSSSAQIDVGRETGHLMADEDRTRDGRLLRMVVVKTSKRGGKDRFYQARPEFFGDTDPL